MHQLPSKVSEELASQDAESFHQQSTNHPTHEPELVGIFVANETVHLPDGPPFRLPSSATSPAAVAFAAPPLDQKIGIGEGTRSAVLEGEAALAGGTENATAVTAQPFRTSRARRSTSITTKATQSREGVLHPAATESEPSGSSGLELGSPSDNATVEEDEAELTRRINELWKEEQTTQSRVRKSREQLAELRTNLGSHLSSYKAVLVSRGRKSRWTAFLREINLPRTTADRYVKHWLDAQKPKPEETSDATSPSREQINALVTRLKPRLIRALPDEPSIQTFLTTLTQALLSGHHLRVP